MKTRFDITGMSCAACQARVEKVVARVPGVKQAQVNLLQNRLDVDFMPDKVSAAQIIAAVESAGYGARVHRAQNTQIIDETSALKKRFFYSLLFLLPLWCGHFFHLPAVYQFIFTLPVLVLNRQFFRSGLGKLFTAPNMDSLVALGAGASVLFSLWAWGKGEHHLYFESAAMILTLVTMGKWLEARAKAKTSGALAQLVKLLPATAVVKRGETEISLPLAQIETGEEVMVRAGERIACDGVVVSGAGAADESALTGESLPQEKQAGANVRAGTLLVSGFIAFRVTKTGAETSFARLIALTEEAASGKAPIARLADKVSAVFVPVVMGIALLTFIGWYFSGAPFAFALTCAVSVLVISCPCALGLATPTAIMVGMGVGARQNILIKSADVLEESSRITRVVLDKTGTITTGRMQVVRAVAADGVTTSDLWRAAVSVEYGSQHPFARAIIRYAQEHQLTCEEVQDFEQVQGLGVRARLNGDILSGGNEKAMRAWGISIPQADALTHQAAQAGQSVLFFARGTKFLGAVSFADTLKDSAREAVVLLQRLGVKILLLSGDTAQTCAAVARQAGIAEAVGGVLPDEKQNVIRELQARGEEVAMVGDGINDAPSLMRADVGVALGSGTDIAAESAGIILLTDDVRAVPDGLELACAVMRNIKQNLFWAFFYNILGIPLAAGVLYKTLGWQLSPVFAAAAMSLSSVCVVSNALRLRSFKPTRLKKEWGVMQKTLTIEGMMCGHCAAHVERALNAINGVRAKVDLAKKIAVVTAAQEIPDDVLKEAVRNAGYEVTAIQ